MLRTLRDVRGDGRVWKQSFDVVRKGLEEP